MAHLRLGWWPTESAEISVIGQDLLAPRHLEFIEDVANVFTQNVHKIFAKITWRF